MPTCEGCGGEFEDWFFEPSNAPNACMFEDIGLSRVCKTCQVTHKACTMCHKEKPATRKFWHPKSNGLLGLYSRCIVCHNALQLQNYQKNKQERTAAMRLRYALVKENQNE